MSNRHERRAAKARKDEPDMMAIEIKIGRCLMVGRSQVTCYVCGNEAKGYGIARIECHCGTCDGKPFDLPLCEACTSSTDINETIARKVWGAPNLKIEKGGTYETMNQLKRDIATATDAAPDAKKH